LISSLLLQGSLDIGLCELEVADLLKEELDEGSTVVLVVNLECD